MFQVWRINKLPQKTDAFSINRSETWSWSKDEAFEDQETAESYVILQNYKFCGYDLHVFDASSETMRERCLTNPDWSYARSFFLEYPGTPFEKNKIRDLIVSQLKSQHVQVS